MNKLYLISQGWEDGYDTFDSAVVVAESEDDAIEIHPSSYVTHVTNGKWMGTFANSSSGEYDQDGHSGWVPYRLRDKVKVEYLGETARDRGLILASFNAG